MNNSHLTFGDIAFMLTYERETRKKNKKIINREFKTSRRLKAHFK